MMDSDLASLYQVETKALVRQVQRNPRRFPGDFMFRLTVVDYQNLRCQFGTSSSRHSVRRYLPYVFSEQRVAMLSSALRSSRAARVNVVFNAIRRLVAEPEPKHRPIGFTAKLED